MIRLKRKGAANVRQSRAHAAIVFFVMLLVYGGLLVAWLVLLTAAWRGMKAHESIAESLRRIADKMLEGSGTLTVLPAITI